MAWANLQAYTEALQSPRLSFDDPELQQSQVVTNKLGLPRPVSGNFATVFTLKNGTQQWAVRCFSREMEKREKRYESITQHLKQHHLPYMVNFEYLPKGIRVSGNWYPILKMEWIQGMGLDQYIKANLENSEKLQSLLKQWVDVCQTLREAKITHGDLQHGNILVTDQDQIKLIDYDGMILRSTLDLPTGEVGHRHYQHPSRQSDQGVQADNFLVVDNFSSHIIASSIKLLSIDPTLWDKSDGGDDNLIFRDTDYKDVYGSQLFRRLREHPDKTIQTLADRLRESVINPSSYLDVSSISLTEQTSAIMPSLYRLYLNLPLEEIQEQHRGSSWLEDHIKTEVVEKYSFPEELIIEIKKTTESEFSGKNWLPFFKFPYNNFTKKYIKEYFEKYEIVAKKRQIEMIYRQTREEKQLCMKDISNLEKELMQINNKLKRFYDDLERQKRNAYHQKESQLANIDKQSEESFYLTRLKHFIIQPSMIPGIGQKRIDALNSIGIRDASHIIPTNKTKAIQALRQVHGSNGTDDWEKLLKWYNTKKQQIPLPSQYLGNEEIQHKKNTVETKYKDKLREIDQQVQSNKDVQIRIKDQIEMKKKVLLETNNKLERFQLELKRYSEITEEVLLRMILQLKIINLL